MYINVCVCVCVCLALIASGNVRIFGSFWKQMQARNDEIQQEQQQTSTETDSRTINNGVNFIYICVNAESRRRNNVCLLQGG